MACYARCRSHSLWVLVGSKRRDDALRDSSRYRNRYTTRQLLSCSAPFGVNYERIWYTVQSPDLSFRQNAKLAIRRYQKIVVGRVAQFVGEAICDESHVPLVAVVHAARTTGDQFVAAGLCLGRRRSPGRPLKETASASGNCDMRAGASADDHAPGDLRALESPTPSPATHGYGRARF